MKHNTQIEVKEKGTKRKEKKKIAWQQLTLCLRTML
jgi:hypothetical protein